MARPSPTRDGFRAMFQQPALGMAEVLWRWSFGATFCLLLALCFAGYLRGLPISKAQMLLIGSGETMLVLKALQQVFAGSTPRLIRACFVLVAGAGAGWVIFASVGRAVTLRGLLADRNLPVEKITFRSMAGLSVLRALAFIGGCILSLAVLAALANSQQGDSSLGVAVFLCLLGMTIIWLVWSAGNWFLSVAAIFVAKEGCNTFSAIGRVAGLCAQRPGALFAVGFWFGLVRVAGVYIAGMFCVFFVAVAPLSSAAVVAAFVASSLAYFLLADFLYIGRLAAYLSIADWPTESPAMADERGSNQGPLDSKPLNANAVDREELILSDFSSRNSRPEEA